MKKLSIRSIFILILVLVLAFARVACGEKDEPKPEPKPEDSVENVQAFFNTLWEKSSSIGNTKVGEKDDLKVDLGLTVKIATQDEAGTEYQTIDLGVDLDLVLGAEVLPDLVPYGIVERHGPFGCIVRVVAVDAESQCGLRCARRSLEIPVDYTSGMDLFEPVVTSKVGASHIV